MLLATPPKGIKHTPGKEESVNPPTAQLRTYLRAVLRSLSEEGPSFVSSFLWLSTSSLLLLSWSFINLLTYHHEV